MLCQDGDPRNEQIINILLNNGQVSKRDLIFHQKYLEKFGSGDDYKMLMDKNVTNIRMLNDMNKTALYYSTQTRKKNFGWGHEVGNILKFDHMIHGDNKSKADRAMINLQKKVTKDEVMIEIYEARRRKSKQPSSLTLEQEDRARERFYKNKLPGNQTIERKAVIEMINIDGNGLIDMNYYPRY